MIQSTELRIGNYCLEDGKMYQVTLADFYNMHKDDGANRLQPIPLTEDILIKCGFVVIDGTNCHRLKNDICDIIVYPSGHIELWNDIETIKINTAIKYLHQLQNLYFSLTGNELQVNL